VALNEIERKVIARLASEISGADNLSATGLDFLFRNVEKRIRETGVETMALYLRLVQDDEQEHQNFVSALTIHTTSWFRERPHFEFLRRRAEDFHRTRKGEIFRVWSAACSTGEEAYSIAIVLCELQQLHPDFQFEVLASDVDPSSVEIARNGVYPERGMESLVASQNRFFLRGQGPTQGLVAVAGELRQKVHFFVHNIDEVPGPMLSGKVDVVFCRNVLIYFSVDSQERILRHLSGALTSRGCFVLGHSDTLPVLEGFRRLSGSCLVRDSANSPLGLERSRLAPSLRPRALVVDDSATLRRVLGSILSKSFEVSEAESAEDAERQVGEGDFDFIALDLNLPGENGVSWLQRLRRKNKQTPVCIVSESSPQDAEKVFGALEGGAQEYIVKSSLMADPTHFLETARSLAKPRASTDSHHLLATFRARSNFDPQAILIGASTGGPEALLGLLRDFPAGAPPVIVVQHIGTEFALPFAKRLAERSGLVLGDTAFQGPLKRGHLYMADGDYHLRLIARGDELLLQRDFGEKVQGHRPSVDVLFQSASHLSTDLVAMLLTGMGRDGAQGLRSLYDSGRVYTMAQDEPSSVVFGMPKIAIELGAACVVGDLSGLRRDLEKRIAA
jgi:two-component system chemotaxis response regulator CheB